MAGDAMAEQVYEIDDGKTLDENLTELRDRLKALDNELGPVLAAHLTGLIDGSARKDDVWNDLLAAVPVKVQK